MLSGSIETILHPEVPRDVGLSDKTPSNIAPGPSIDKSPQSYIL